MKEEHRLRNFKNRVLREIFGSKRTEVTWERRIPHNNELYDQINKNEMGGACNTWETGEVRTRFWWGA